MITEKVHKILEETVIATTDNRLARPITFTLHKPSPEFEEFLLDMGYHYKPEHSTVRSKIFVEHVEFGEAAAQYIKKKIITPSATFAETLSKVGSFYNSSKNKEIVGVAFSIFMRSRYFDGGLNSFTAPY